MMHDTISISFHSPIVTLNRDLQSIFSSFDLIPLMSYLEQLFSL